MPNYDVVTGQRPNGWKRTTISQGDDLILIIDSCMEDSRLQKLIASIVRTLEGSAERKKPARS